ncbi:hypothetical protein A1O3_09728 [Capronia epimyces CBS 606.96]|uniref:Major facilitator superfamily (MFS) profile domain-containing protein n=1 Tax=Capronia epimyces CBS 606.96 TaxID=1182542 RepID=W9XAK4_9EURO|nr:uncharacterized protein A1O3_09728 [Capronia epimyces CBS 606.96]EXJ77502.1 hypothetical protein A1O3_09728 [Capronia epimyces CBS 606.96]
MGFFSNRALQAGEREQKLNGYNVLVLFLLAPASLTYGYSASIISTTLGQPSFLEYFNLLTAPNATSLLGATGGLFFAGATIGPLLLPWIADKYGRKWSIAASLLVSLVAFAVEAGSTHIAEFLAFRFVAGAGSFMLLAAVPLLMNEVVPSRMRGGLVELHAVFFVLGFALASWVGFGFSFWVSRSPNAWRAPLAIGCFWSLLSLVCLYWVPESPRWLILQDREAEAEIVLNRLHSDKHDPDNTYARAEYYQIIKQIAIDRTLGSSWWHMVKKPSYRKRALIATAVTFFIQASGDLVINNYGPTLYKMLGYGTTQQLLYSAAWLTFTLGMSVLAMPMVDRLPRNVMLAIGLWGCMSCLVVEAALLAEFVPSDNQNALRAAVAMFFVFQVFDTAMLNAPEWAYLGEIFPTHIRSKGYCLAISTLALSNVCFTQAAPTAFRTVGWKFYLLFIILTFIGGFVSIFTFPDTRFLPLEEIAAIFGDTDEVAIYQREIEVQHNAHGIIDHHDSGSVKVELTHMETADVEKSAI